MPVFCGKEGPKRDKTFEKQPFQGFEYDEVLVPIVKSFDRDDLRRTGLEKLPELVETRSSQGPWLVGSEKCFGRSISFSMHMPKV